MSKLFSMSVVLNKNWLFSPLCLVCASHLFAKGQFDKILLLGLALVLL